MPRPSTIKTLPTELRQEFDRFLADRPDLTLDDLTAWLNERLADEGVTVSVSRSAVGRYRQSYEEAVQHMRETREMAAGFARELPNFKNDKVGELLLEALHTLLFKAATAQTEADQVKPMDVMLLCKSIKDLFATSKIGVETEAKIRQEAEEQARKKIASEVEDTARAQGLGEEQARFWREKVLGVR